MDKALGWLLQTSDLGKEKYMGINGRSPPLSLTLSPLSILYQPLFNLLDAECKVDRLTLMLCRYEDRPG